MESIVGSFRPLYKRVIPKAIRLRVATTRANLSSRGLRTLSARIRKRMGYYLASVRLEHGRFFVDLRDLGVGLPTYILRQYEQKECDYLRKTITRDMVAYDIGANVGIMMALMSILTGEHGEVVGFEPDSYNYDLARRNVAENKLHNTTLINCALGSEEATLHVYRSLTNFGDHRVYQSDKRTAGHEIQVHRLDSLTLERKLRLPDFIKIDVQGYEVEVLKGMEGLLVQDRQLAILIEYWPHGIRSAGSDPIAIRQIMSRNGFQAFEIDNDGTLVEADWDRLDSELARSTDTDNCYANLVFRKLK